MFKKIDKEILFGGILGIIAIVAAIGEMIAMVCQRQLC